MTTETNAQDEAKKIWEQLDAEDSGRSAPTELATEESVASTQERPTTSGDPTLEDDPRVLRDKIAGLEAIVQQFGGRLRNAEGHIGGLNSQLKQQIEVAKRVDSAGGDAPTAREIQAAQDDPKAFAELERDYPEFAKAVKAPIDSLRSQLADLQSKVGQPAQGQSTDAETYRQEMAALRSEMRVESRHPGWLETVAKPEFAGWLQQSPREMQMLAASDRPVDAIRLLDLYANARNSGSKTNQRLQSAAALPTGQRTTARTKNVDDMTPQEYWRYLDDIDRQKA